MNHKKIYGIAFLALLFSACNGNLDTTPAPSNSIKTTFNKKSAVSMANSSISQQSQLSSSSSQISTRVGGLNYIVKPIVLEEGMFHIKGFMKTLKPTLDSALAQDGSGVIAMGTCKSIASKMVDEYNNVTPNVTIRRTALKYRNPLNKPDNIDKKVMYELEDKRDFKPVAIDMGNSYRVYKPIKMEAKCIVCHGSSDKISPKVMAMIKHDYPKDMATGFNVGDFRGVVIAEFPKHH
jgi:hypothetical protein